MLYTVGDVEDDRKNQCPRTEVIERCPNIVIEHTADTSYTTLRPK
jgi:hypothetical protein